MKFYTVQAGDTLSLLAPVLMGPGYTWQDLHAHNPQITNPDLIEVGDMIYYPDPTKPTPPGLKMIFPPGLFKSPMFLYSLAGVVVLTALLLLPKPRKAA